MQGTIQDSVNGIQNFALSAECDLYAHPVTLTLPDSHLVPPPCDLTVKAAVRAIKGIAKAVTVSRSLMPDRLAVESLATSRGGSIYGLGNILKTVLRQYAFRQGVSEPVNVECFRSLDMGICVNIQHPAVDVYNGFPEYVLAAQLLVHAAANSMRFWSSSVSFQLSGINNIVHAQINETDNTTPFQHDGIIKNLSHPFTFEFLLSCPYRFTEYLIGKIEVENHVKIGASS